MLNKLLKKVGLKKSLAKQKNPAAAKEVQAIMQKAGSSGHILVALYPDDSAGVEIHKCSPMELSAAVCSLIEELPKPLLVPVLMAIKERSEKK